MDSDKMELPLPPYKCDVCETPQLADTQRHTITVEPIETYVMCNVCAFRLLGNLISLCEGSMLIKIIEHIMKEIKRERAEQCTKIIDPSS